MKYKMLRVDMVLPNDEKITEFFRTKSNRVNKVYDQINTATVSKYGIMIGDLKSIKVWQNI